MIWVVVCLCFPFTKTHNGRGGQGLTSELGTDAQVQSLRVPYMRSGYKGYIETLVVLYVFIGIDTEQTYGLGSCSGDRRGQPCMLLKHLLHDPSCCLFVVSVHNDSIMDRESDNALRPESK